MARKTARFVTSVQAAKILGLTRGMVNHLVRTGKLKAEKWGGGETNPYMIDEASLREYIKEREQALRDEELNK